jgi:hypothetical protein
MSDNLTFTYAAISGLFCQCGNAEVITDDHPRYHRFSSWHDTSGGRGCSKVSCLKCNSDTHPPHLLPQPADLPKRLQAAYPAVDVDDLLAKCAVAH